MTIDERIELLMQPGCDYDPLRVDNLAETLANLELEQVAGIAIELREHLHHLMGVRIKQLTNEHWKKLATTQAQADEEREQDEACPKCGGNEGKGCPECDAKLRMENRHEKI